MIKVLNNKVAILPIEDNSGHEVTLESGIVIPATITKPSQIGKVVATGLDSKSLLGNTVIYSCYKGIVVHPPSDDRYIVIEDKDILCTIEETK